MILHCIDTRDVGEHYCFFGNAELGAHRGARGCVGSEMVDVDAVGKHLRAPRMIPERQMRFHAGDRVGRHHIGPSR